MEKRPQLTAYKKFLAIRDGKECWYCSADLPKDKLTIEHVLNVVDGGSHHPHNLVLACRSCNVLAGRMSVSSKVKMREDLRSLNVQTT